MNFKEKKVGLLAKLLVDTIERDNINEFLIRGKRYVKVRKGKWINGGVIEVDDLAFEEWQQAQCSSCGKWHTTPYKYCFEDYNFCPHCGADMRGEDNAID